MQKEYKLTQEIIDIFLEMNEVYERRDKYISSVFQQRKAEQCGKKYWELKQKGWKKFFDLFPEALERSKQLDTKLEWRLGWDFILETSV